MKKIISILLSLALTGTMTAVHTGAVTQYSSDNIPVLSFGEGLLIYDKTYLLIGNLRNDELPTPNLVRIFDEMPDDSVLCDLPAFQLCWIKNMEQLIQIKPQYDGIEKTIITEGYKPNIVGEILLSEKSVDKLTLIDYSTDEERDFESVYLLHDTLDYTVCATFKRNSETNVTIGLSLRNPSDKIVDNYLKPGIRLDVPGDINADGIIDLSDLSELSLALIGDVKLTETQKSAADVDGDGKVTLADLAKFRQYLSKQIESLA